METMMLDKIGEFLFFLVFGVFGFILENAVWLVLIGLGLWAAYEALGPCVAPLAVLFAMSGLHHLFRK